MSELARAQQRLIDAVTLQAEKGRAYARDPLFMHLWQTGWGTTEYQGRGFTRLIDGWIARVCHYESARATYWLLNEIPERLRKHIAQLEHLA